MLGFGAALCAVLRAMFRFALDGLRDLTFGRIRKIPKNHHKFARKTRLFFKPARPSLFSQALVRLTSRTALGLRILSGKNEQRYIPQIRGTKKKKQKHVA